MSESDASEKLKPHPASFWQTEAHGFVRCNLCPHACRIAPGHFGRCQVRENRDGTLIATAYGKISALAVDPIEKKPLRYFRPGSQILSVGSYGCNFVCPYCQNASIAQSQPPTHELWPQELAARAGSLKSAGNIGVAFTYNEPLVHYEYVQETARLIRAQKQCVVLVTNGYIQPQPLAELLPLVDAMNIDLKAFSENFYRDLCRGRLQPVLSTIATAAKSCHVEVTTLLIPGYNDGEEEIAALAQYLASIDPNLPLHLTRYFPAHEMKVPPIEVERMQALRRIAGQSLRRVVLGNV